MQTAMRNANLSDLVTLLRTQSDVRFDVVAHSSNLQMEAGNLVIDGGHAVITDDGVSMSAATLVPTEICDSGLATKLDIPISYVRKMRSGGEANLLDENVNTWLAKSDQNWLVRGFKGESDDTGIGRAFLSSGYRVIDNLDCLMAALDGIRQAGVAVDIRSCDLTERRMSVKIEAPEVVAFAPELLKNYRSPFTGDVGLDNPLISAGLHISNSETGGGAFTIAPYLTVQVCKNGMTMTKDALRQVHLGARMDEGVIRWSTETMDQNVALITSQASDAVRTFLDVDYITKKIEQLEMLAGAKITNVVGTLERVGKKFGFSAAEQDLILADFISGGDPTAGGVMQAVTSVAQRLDDADRAYDFESSAVEVLAFAATI